jgi:hypothetical protein
MVREPRSHPRSLLDRARARTSNCPCWGRTGQRLCPALCNADRMIVATTWQRGWQPRASRGLRSAPDPPPGWESRAGFRCDSSCPPGPGRQLGGPGRSRGRHELRPGRRRAERNGLRRARRDRPCRHVGAGERTELQRLHPRFRRAAGRSRHLRFRTRIDHVLTRGAAAPASKAKLTGLDADNRTPAGLWPSDHAGLVTTLFP